MKKILISLTYYLPNISGVTFYAHWLAKGLAKRDHKVTILTSQYKPELKNRETKEGIEIIRVKPLFSIGKGVIMPTFPIIAFQEIKKHDVIICHLPQFESSILALLGKVLGKQTFLTHHTDLSGWKGLLNQISEKSVYLSQHIAAKLADLIIPYTKDYAEHSKFLKPYLSKVKPTYPPIQVSKPNTDYLKKLESKFKSERFKIGFSGRIAKQKGIPYLLKAIPYLEKTLNANFKIFFAGPYKNVIGENYFETLKPLINKYKDKVEFLGNLNPGQLSAFYKFIDVLVLPSDDRLESFGIVQVEAMSCGTPVVCTNLPGVRIPILKTGMGKIVPLKNSAALAEGITKIVKNKEKYIQPKEKIEQIFDFEKTIDFYEKNFQI